MDEGGMPGGMNRGLMYGLIGIGVAIVLAGIFIFLAVAGPKLFSGGTSRAEVGELQVKIDDAEALLAAKVQELSDAQQTISEKDREISRLETQINVLKVKPKEEPTPITPEQNPTNITTYNETRTLNLNDFSTLTKQNCNEAIVLAKRNESWQKNYTENLSIKLDGKRDLRNNLTVKRDNATATNHTSEATDYQNQIDDVEDEIDDLKDEIDISDAAEGIATDLRKRVIYQCNKVTTS